MAWASFEDQRRRQAAERGWKYVGGKERGLSGRYRGRAFHCYEKCARMGIGYPTGGYYDSYSTFCVITLPSSVPPLWVSRTTWGALGESAAARGHERIKIADDEFNRKFAVRSDDARFATMVLRPTLVELLKSSRTPDWNIGDSMGSSIPGRLTPMGALAHLDRMCDVLDRISAKVWKYRPGPRSA